MKNLIQLILIGILLATSLFACSNDNDAQTEELIVSTEQVLLGKSGGDKVMHIKTNAKWTISSSETWCTVTPTAGDGTGTIKLIVNATENTSTDTRSAVLTITGGSIVKQVAVSQALTNLLTIAKKEYEIKTEGELITIDFQSTGDVQIRIDGEWISQSPTRAITSQSLSFAIAGNNSLFDREGTITFTLDDLSEKVSLTQKANLLQIADDKTGMTSDAPALAGKMGLGWNLGNSLEATSTTTANETMWGNPATTKSFIDAVKAAGFNTVRIPCAWSAYVVDNDTYRIKDSWIARVKEVVDYCVENDMYAIINIHWDGGWLEENPTANKQEEVNKKQKALWEQIAVYFRNYDEHLLFAGTNEVHDGYGEPTNENITVQLSYNQTFVDAVRSTGGKNTWRNLVVQAYNTNIDQAVKYLKMPADPTANRVMAEVHYYDPYEFCLQDDNSVFLWGKEFTGAGTISWGQEDWVDAQFAKVKANFVDKGIPVILGEYGVMLRASLSTADYANHIKSRNHYLNYVTKAAVKNGMIPVYWDSGITGDKASGLFNRATSEQVHADAILSIISGGK